jgi:GT2 family glycosyltransferase
VDLSLVIVTYYSSPVLPACISSFRREAQQLKLNHEIVVVECSEDEDEYQAVVAAGPDQCLQRENRGYAAGINAGAKAATGDLLLLANPDIELLAGSLGALLDGLRQGYQVVGPQLVWDQQGRLFMPVPDDPGPVAELWRAMRRQWPSCWQWGLDRELERIRRVWQAPGPVAAPCLRGPAIAMTQETWNHLGPLDEGYFLYYEETEWLWRAHRRGTRLAVVGNAQVVHTWGHATNRRADRDQIEERSRQRFYQRNYPRHFRWLLSHLDHSWSLSCEKVSGANALPERKADLWLLSPYPHLLPAGGWLGSREQMVEPPAALSQLTADGAWNVAAASYDRGSWRLVGRWCWESR